MSVQATIHLDPRFNAGPLDRRIFGGFLEHMGRAVYEGVFDPGNPLSDERGFRLDVLESLRGLDMSLVRYPGGNFVSNYDWRDGVGPVDERPVRPDFAWQSIEPNTFGTDEFITWCRELGADPVLAVNLGTLGPKEAAALVEYCNLQPGTSYADLRQENGSSEPHGVSLWCLGNEMDGPWQAGHVPAEVYARQANAASRLMKGLDPTIETVACGSSGTMMSTYLEWDRSVLETCWDTVDFISAHRYSRNDEDDTAAFLAEGTVIDRIIEDYAGLLAYVRGVKRSKKQVHISFDEWNVWYKKRDISDMRGGWQRAPHLIEEVYNLEDALVCAQYLNAFIRHADVVKVACIAQIANIIAPILTREDGLLIQSIYWPFKLISESARGTALSTSIDAPTYSAGRRGDVPVVDVAATLDEEAGELCISAVNRSQSDAVEVDIDLSGFVLGEVRSAQQIHHEDPKASNDWGASDVITPQEAEALVTGDKLRLNLPPLSHAVVRTAARRQ